MKTLDIWEIFEKSGFFNRMRRKLKAREKKQSWNNSLDDIPLPELIDHLFSEVDEFKQGIGGGDWTNVQEECADIANCCAFIYSKIEKRLK